MPKISASNLSGGLFTSPDKTQIPEISWSGLSNFDVENSSLATRNGMTQSTTGIYPGCLQFGYAAGQKTHFMQASSTYAPDFSSDTSYNFFVMNNESTTATTATILEITDSTSAPLVKMYWGSSETLSVEAKAAGGTLETHTTTTIVRGAGASNLVGVSLRESTTSGSWRLYTYNADGLQYTSGLITGVSSTHTWNKISLGTNTTISDPEGAWGSATNYAFHGQIGELCITKNIVPSATTAIARDFNVTGPGSYTQTDNKIAYYPLQNDYDDAWGLQPSFKPTAPFDAGSGLSAYLVDDTILPNAKNQLFCTKSWHINTINKDRHVYASTTGLGATHSDYFNATGSKYTVTFDLQPVKITSTTNYPIFKGLSGGPTIELQKNTGEKSKIAFAHAFNASTSLRVTGDIFNNQSQKISCEFSHSTTNNNMALSIWSDLGKIASSSVTATTTSVGTGEWQMGQADTSGIDAEMFLSGLLMHNVATMQTWSTKPREDVKEITSYSNAIQDVLGARRLNVAGMDVDITTANQSFDDLGRDVSDEIRSRVRERGNTSTQDPRVYSIYDLPNFTSIFGMYLFNETTGYDTASANTPHGNLHNASTTVGAQTDLVIKGNTAPVWVNDRNAVGLTTTTVLPNFYYNEPDSAFSYTPTSTNLNKRVMVANNNLLVDTSATTYRYVSTYSPYDKSETKMRGFMYGNDMYLHDKDHSMKFTGNTLRPTIIQTPTAQLSLTVDNTPASGLQGGYSYTYTLKDKNGNESYPALPTSVTVSTGKVIATLNSRLNAQASQYNDVLAVNIYRNWGTVVGTTLTSTTVLKTAGETFYLNRSIPIERAKSAFDSATTLFTDDTADSALSTFQNPPIPGTADNVPNCKYSTVFNDTAYFTGDEAAPNFYYKSFPENPSLLSLGQEYRTEDGEHNTAIATIGNGFIVFKKGSRKYVRNNGSGFEYQGGCMSHDSITRVDNFVIGLGNDGFFMCDGSGYRNISTVSHAGRVVSSVKYDVDQWSDAVKSSAIAVFDASEGRYICYVNDKYYIFDIIRKIWSTYSDFVGIPLIHDNTFNMFKRGWKWTEATTQAFGGANKHVQTIGTGTTGVVTATFSTAPDTTKDFGLPVYIDDGYYWVNRIINTTGSTYRLEIDTNTSFATATKLYLGVIRCHADTKFMQGRTPNRNKYFFKFLAEHDNASDGEINIRTARNSNAFDLTQTWYVADTDVEKINCTLRHRSENVGVQLECKDGVAHKIHNWEAWFRQDSLE